MKRSAWHLAVLAAMGPVLVASLPAPVDASPATSFAALVKADSPLPPLSPERDSRPHGRTPRAAEPLVAAPDVTCYPMPPVTPAVPGPVPLPHVEPPMRPVPMPRLVPDCDLGLQPQPPDLPVPDLRR